MGSQKGGFDQSGRCTGSFYAMRASYNVWSGITPLGAGSTILDLEDFIVSNNLLPLGSLVYLLFCTTKLGWGYENFLKETNTGKGMKFPRQIAFYVKYILPLIVLFIFVMGYYTKFFA